VRVGHYRRYRRDELKTKLRTSGFDPLSLHYVNAPGLLAWLVMMKIAGGYPRDGFALRSFEQLVRILRRIEDRWSPPFGQSVFAVGRRR
jgi:hypothetical protein